MTMANFLVKPAVVGGIVVSTGGKLGFAGDRRCRGGGSRRRQ
jgi:hypothetical protein